MEEDRVIGAGVFYKGELISVAYLNLLKYGCEKYIPYYCAAWTKKEYRGNGLIGLVNKKLEEELDLRADELGSYMFTTIDGGEPAIRACSKDGYCFREGEMSFLGDVKKDNNIEEISINDNEDIVEIVYGKDGEKILSIVYSKEQLFSHPANEDGRLSRLIKFKKWGFVDKGLFSQVIKCFLSDHRFCKLNVVEVGENSLDVLTSLGFDLGDYTSFGEFLMEFGFKANDNVMVKTIGGKLTLKH